MAKPETRFTLKFKLLCQDLRLPAPYVLGLLECMWHCAYATANDLIGSADDVELACEWPGKSGILVHALLKRRWIDEKDGQFYVHDLYENAPEHVKAKITRRQNKDLQQKTKDRKPTNTRPSSSSSSSSFPSLPTSSSSGTATRKRPASKSAEPANNTAAMADDAAASLRQVGVDAAAAASLVAEFTTDAISRAMHAFKTGKIKTPGGIVQAVRENWTCVQPAEKPDTPAGEDKQAKAEQATRIKAEDERNIRRVRELTPQDREATRLKVFDSLGDEAQRKWFETADVCKSPTAAKWMCDMLDKEPVTT